MNCTTSYSGIMVYVIQLQVFHLQNKLSFSAFLSNTLYRSFSNVANLRWTRIPTYPKLSSFNLWDFFTTKPNPFFEKCSKQKNEIATSSLQGADGETVFFATSFTQQPHVTTHSKGRANTCHVHPFTHFT